MNECLGEGWKGGLNITIIRLQALWIGYILRRVKFKIITYVEGHSAPYWLSFLLNIIIFFQQMQDSYFIRCCYCNWQWNTSHQQEVTAALPFFTLWILNTNREAERCVYKNGKQSEAVTLKHNVGRFLEPKIYDHRENSIILITIYISITKITYPCGM